METSLLQAHCEKCEQRFEVDTEKTPYQSMFEPQPDMKVVEKRTYHVECPHCGTKNTIIQPVTKSLSDLQEISGNIKTVNIKGGPACLVMIGILLLLLTLGGTIGYFLIKGIGTVFSWI